MQFPTTTPTPPPSVIIQQATEALDTWNQLGPIMGLLLVVALSVITILVIAYFNRNSNSTAITVLVKNIESKDREIDELEKQRKADREANAANLTAIRDLLSNGIKLGENRDARQAEMLQNQARIATAFETLLLQGSAPLQKVVADVGQLMVAVNSIDTRTSNWQTIIDSIPGIKEQFNRRMDELAGELKRRKTQPIPPVEIPPTGESGQP